jgi:hypothetical protein
MNILIKKKYIYIKSINRNSMAEKWNVYCTSLERWHTCISNVKFFTVAYTRRIIRSVHMYILTVKRYTTIEPEAR